MSEKMHDQVDANPPGGTPSWLELSVPDPERARTFYGTLFGWTFEDDLCLLDGLPVAAIRPLADGPGKPDGPEWTVFFATDDCDHTAERVSAAGGRVVQPPHEAGERGRAAVVTDVLGARFGLWQGKELVGTRLVNGPGTFIFNELPTLEQEHALAFYRTVFGYRPPRRGDTGDLIRPDGHTVASIVLPELPDETAWLTYFAVEDVRESVDLLVESGGWSHPEGPRDLPWGSIATVKDPLGTPFRLVEPWDVI